ncbi:rRNA methyltransferase [Streptomyces sp. HNM0574]|nr:rRNA methyltransferase [Streptomyces sp. HNM0574]
MDGQLRTALAQLLDGLPPRKATAAVERLIANYRGKTPTEAPVLRDRADVVAYAAYRMPATFAAVSAALGALADRLDGWAPADHVDVGGGTGAATWATAATWDDAAPEGGVTRATTVLDWAAPALDLGRELAASSGSPALRAAEWRRRSLRSSGEPLPAADLVTVSYVLGELEPEDRRAVTDSAAGAGRAVVIVEPGTPDGYLRIREARETLTAAGLRVLAPCPHSGQCPIVPGEDWCHFAARVPRSSLHRQVKGGSLAYEDEKFAYVAAVRPELVPGTPAASRVVRRPVLRKGQVLLDLCTADEELRRTTVTKRHGADYKAARNTDWGDAWPPG